MDTTDRLDPQRLQDLAMVAVKEKSNLVRKRVGDGKAHVTCRYDLISKKFLFAAVFAQFSGTSVLKYLTDNTTLRQQVRAQGSWRSNGILKGLMVYVVKL